MVYYSSYITLSFIGLAAVLLYSVPAFSDDKSIVVSNSNEQVVNKYYYNILNEKIDKNKIIADKEFELINTKLNNLDTKLYIFAFGFIVFFVDGKISMGNMEKKMEIKRIEDKEDQRLKRIEDKEDQRLMNEKMENKFKITSFIAIVSLVSTSIFNVLKIFNNNAN